MDLARAAAEGDRGGAAIAGVGWLVGWLALAWQRPIGQSIDFLRRLEASDSIADSVDICKGGGAWLVHVG